MPYRDDAPLPKQMTILIGLCVVGLMAFGLAISFYKNVLFDRQLLEMRQRNAQMKREILEGYRRLQYLRSAQYKDKYAKESIGLLHPGEKVLILAVNDQQVASPSSTELSEEEKQAIFEENLRNIRVVDQWKIFLFHHEAIEELRKRAG